jgi:hypothetical protein
MTFYSLCQVLQLERRAKRPPTLPAQAGKTMIGEITYYSSDNTTFFHHRLPTACVVYYSCMKCSYIGKKLANKRKI